jgi:DNA-binding MarR family transcriptional regulator
MMPPKAPSVRPKRARIAAAVEARRSPSATSIAPLPAVPSAAGGPPLLRRAAPLSRRFQQVCAALVAQALAGEDVVQLEYGSLVALEVEPGIDQRRLAEAMGIDPTNAFLIVDRLQSKGLVERRVHPADRRARQLFLTPKGKALWRRLRGNVLVANDRALAPLAPAERELFLDMLIRIIEGNREHARPGAGRRKRGSLEASTGQK